MAGCEEEEAWAVCVSPAKLCRMCSSVNCSSKLFRLSTRLAFDYGNFFGVKSTVLLKGHKVHTSISHAFLTSVVLSLALQAVWVLRFKSITQETKSNNFWLVVWLVFGFDAPRLAETPAH